MNWPLGFAGYAALAIAAFVWLFIIGNVVLFAAGYVTLLIVGYVLGYWVFGPWMAGFKACTSPKRAATDYTRRPQ